MILPTKHIALSESIIGLAGYLLTLLKDGSYSIDMIWNRLTNPQNDIDACFTRHSIDNVVLAIDLLFMMKVVDVNDEGKIYLL